MSARVLSLHRYPVKSMLGEDLAGCTLTTSGVLGDRGWAVVDADDGKVASAKNPRKWGGLLQWTARYVAEPTADRLAPPVELTGPGGQVLRSDDADVAARLSDALGRPVQLTTTPPPGRIFEEVWPDVEGLAPEKFIRDTTSGREESDEPYSDLELGLLAPADTFFDLAVLHLLTTSTLTRLAELAPGADFDPRRYRPNVVVADAGEGFVEDVWVGRTLRLGDRAQVPVSMLTMRCVMTTLAQRDVGRDAATLRAVAKHHRRDIPGLGTWACAGVYAGVAEPGEVRVGDVVAAG